MFSLFGTGSCCNRLLSVSWCCLLSVAATTIEHSTFQIRNLNPCRDKGARYNAREVLRVDKSNEYFWVIERNNRRGLTD